MLCLGIKSPSGINGISYITGHHQTHQGAEDNESLPSELDRDDEDREIPRKTIVLKKFHGHQVLLKTISSDNLVCKGCNTVAQQDESSGSHHDPTSSFQESLDVERVLQLWVGHNDGVFLL